jgi:hypothetical protein
LTRKQADVEQSFPGNGETVLSTILSSSALSARAFSLSPNPQPATSNDTNNYLQRSTTHPSKSKQTRGSSNQSSKQIQALTSFKFVLADYPSQQISLRGSSRRMLAH